MLFHKVCIQMKHGHKHAKTFHHRLCIHANHRWCVFCKTALFSAATCRHNCTTKNSNAREKKLAKPKEEKLEYTRCMRLSALSVQTNPRLVSSHITTRPTEIGIRVNLRSLFSVKVEFIQLGLSSFANKKKLCEWFNLF